MSNDEVTQHNGGNKMTNKEIYDNPRFALIHHADELTAEQFDYCVKKESYIALFYFADKLTAEQFDDCVYYEPKLAQCTCYNRLTLAQRDYCKNGYPFFPSGFAKKHNTTEKPIYTTWKTK